MSFHRPTLHELATHEAGHAYVFASVVRHGVPEELGLGHDAAGDKHGWCRRTRLLLAGNTFSELQEDVQPYIRWQAAAEIVIAIAGPVAEFRHRHRSRAAGAIVIHQNAEVFLRPDTLDTADDFERIRSVLAYVGTPDPVASLRDLAGVSDDIVAANWPSIRRLAQLLLERRTLDADELHDWFERHPAIRYEGELSI